MEEKQKAKELIEKFYRYAKGQTNEARLINAKFSALECVDEILNSLPHKIERKFYVDSGGNKTDESYPVLVLKTDYWQNIKTEIQNYEP